VYFKASLREAGKTRAQLLDEQSRLFEGGEVTSAVDLIPVNQIAVEPQRPRAGRGYDFLRENAATNG
jgi:hypothetical protein